MKNANAPAVKPEEEEEWGKSECPMGGGGVVGAFLSDLHERAPPAVTLR
jgi:hypothetical protein